MHHACETGAYRKSQGFDKIYVSSEHFDEIKLLNFKCIDYEIENSCSFFYDIDFKKTSDCVSVSSSLC